MPKRAMQIRAGHREKWPSEPQKSQQPVKKQQLTSFYSRQTKNAVGQIR
jgi:hypothetical protein